MKYNYYVKSIISFPKSQLTYWKFQHFIIFNSLVFLAAIWEWKFLKQKIVSCVGFAAILQMLDFLNEWLCCLYMWHVWMWELVYVSVFEKVCKSVCVCVCVKDRKKQRGEIDRTKVRVHCLKIIDGIFVKFLWSLQESKLSWTYLILWVKCPWRQKGRTDKVFNKKWILLFLWVSNHSMRSNQSRTVGTNFNFFKWKIILLLLNNLSILEYLLISIPVYNFLICLT